MTTEITWGTERFSLEFAVSPSGAVHLRRARSGSSAVTMPEGLPLVDILTVADGHTPASGRLVHTTTGSRLQYSWHSVVDEQNEQALVIGLVDPESLLTAILTLSAFVGQAAFRARVDIRNDALSDSAVLLSTTSWSTYLGRSTTGTDARPDWSLVHGFNDWLGEGRWQKIAAGGIHLPALSSELTGHDPRGERAFVSKGTWSTGKNIPTAAVVSEQANFAWLWEIEHNGAWRWEIGDDIADNYIACSGPTDLDHQWSAVLAPGESFASVPVTVALGTDLTTAVEALTAFRRAARRIHADNTEMPVVFNDYMNTLNGDPTTAKLLPLIDAAAAVGAEIFCIDAGWYDDGDDWWDSVGEWTPSVTRFENGLGEVIARIRNAGMTPGLWLEPEVVGVKSPVARSLPEEAFLSRHGQRIVEHDRYHLDLRHPAAIAHLDAVIDRLVDEFDVGFFKLDYNINPGPGTDRGDGSVGANLLEHNRAHLAWIDSVLDRHPALVLENCGSGAMRQDFAMLSRMQLQSTSDQQEFTRYPPIAAAAPLSMLPEQAASWAYPQPEMSLEDVSFSLATGLLGRFYLSGYLNRMTPGQLELVTEAIAANRMIRSEIQTSMPFWPLGLPDWDAAAVALGLASAETSLLTVWNRTAGSSEIALSLPALRGRDVSISTMFPAKLDAWETRWDSESATLFVRNPAATRGARTIRLTHPAPATK